MYGGVDLSDTKLYCYLDERKTWKWTKKVAFALFGRALVNAYILYDLAHPVPKPMIRREFIVNVVESLVAGYHCVPAVRHRRSRAQILADRENLERLSKFRANKS